MLTQGSLQVSGGIFCISQGKTIGQKLVLTLCMSNLRLACATAMSATSMTAACPMLHSVDMPRPAFRSSALVPCKANQDMSENGHAFKCQKTCWQLPSQIMECEHMPVRSKGRNFKVRICVR
jgi:hypothetical protein